MPWIQLRGQAPCTSPNAGFLAGVDLAVVWLDSVTRGASRILLGVIAIKV
jgi:hypothetical protein